LSAYNTLFENNLSEWNGNAAGFDHGIYLGGTNCIVRNNVCRYNDGYGIQFQNTAPNDAPKGCVAYNNLCYGNIGGGEGGQIVFYSTTGSGTNAAFGNTFFAPSGRSAVNLTGAGRFYLTNNIIISANAGIEAYGGAVINADYNFAPRALGYSGPHDVVNTYFGLVTTNKGTYWLAADSPARGKALSIMAGPVDFFSNPQTSATDIGAFQYNSTLASDTRVLDPSPANPNYWSNLSGTNGGSASITVTPSTQNCGTILVGTTADVSFVVQNNGSTSVSGNATVPAPFSIVSGGTYSLGSGESQTVAVRYSPTIVGTDSQTITFTGGSGATAGVSGSAIAAPPPGSLTFQAEAGVLTSPMASGGGYIYQSVDTDVTNGGQAVYTFTLTNQGSYIIETIVNAVDVNANSFFINIDALPVDPTMIWDITPTTGFEQRTVSWRGNGTDGADQFVPQIFNLTAGTHELMIVGREANAQLQQLSIVAMPPPPGNLRITAVR
jgi:hypothetical protein